jgi:hypothetical protein
VHAAPPDTQHKPHRPQHLTRHCRMVHTCARTRAAAAAAAAAAATH